MQYRDALLAQRREVAAKLTEQEQDALWAKITEEQKSLGCRVVIGCDSRWAGEQWTGWVVEEWPSLEALQKFTQFLEQLNWFRYVEAMTVLGTESPLTA